MSEQPIVCEVRRITSPDWSQVTEEMKESIWQVMKHGFSDGTSPNRKAFVGTNRLEDVIAGFFACEDRRMGVQYDKDWTKKPEEGVEFEHLFFALVLSQGQVVLQRKRIDREFVTINLRAMRREFFRLLGMVFRSAGFPSDRITDEPFRETRQKGDLLQIFATYQVTYIKVEGLLGQQIPEDVRLFNPDLDKDIIFRQALNDDYNHVDELEAWGDQAGRETDLRKAKMIKAAMSAGKPQVVKAIVEDQERTFRLTQTERFDTQLDTEPGDMVQELDMQRIIRIVKTEYFIPASLVRAPVSLGPLFDYKGS